MCFLANRFPAVRTGFTDFTVSAFGCSAACSDNTFRHPIIRVWKAPIPPLYSNKRIVREESAVRRAEIVRACASWQIAFRRREQVLQIPLFRHSGAAITRSATLSIGYCPPQERASLPSPFPVTGYGAEPHVHLSPLPFLQRGACVSFFSNGVWGAAPC